MSTVQQRKEHRFGVKIRAYVTNPQNGARFPCLIRDGSLSGCKVTCGRMADLPDEIIVDVPGLAKRVYGTIMWRKGSKAGVKFTWDTSPDDERRAAPRHRVDMAAMILDRGYRRLRECTVCDASRTGCRLKVSQSDSLPKEICLEIEGLTEPMLGRIVWRTEGTAGVEFIWDSEAYLLENAVAIEHDDIWHV